MFNVSVLVPFVPDDNTCLVGRGVAPEKVPESDQYLKGTEGPLYKNVSGDWENIDDSPDIFDEV